MDEDLDNWFAREILTHEAALVRYLTRKWPHRDDVHDLRQEIYIRVYEAAGRSRPTSPKSFLFTTARHLMTDRIRRARIISIDTLGDLDALNVMVDELTPERRTHARQELRLLARAFDQLPPKCREVIWMRRVDQSSQKEVAAQLGITEKAVEKHVMKGMQQLADALFGHDQEHALREETRTGKSGSEHGKQQTD